MTPRRRRLLAVEKGEPLTAFQRIAILEDRGVWDDIAEIARGHKVAPIVVLGVTRRRQETRARHDFAAHLHSLGWSSVSIGRVLGRDHSSVLYGIGRAEARAAHHESRAA